MKTALTSLLIAITFLLCSCPKCKDCNGGNINIDTTAHVQPTPPADTIPACILENAIDMDGYPNYSIASMQIDTSLKLCICPVIVKDTSSNEKMMFVIVSSNRTDILFINTCNILINKNQYALDWAGSVLNEKTVEVHVFSFDSHTINYIPNADEIAFAFWGNFGSTMYELNECQLAELKTLVEYAAKH